MQGQEQSSTSLIICNEIMYNQLINLEILNLKSSYNEYKQRLSVWLFLHVSVPKLISEVYIYDYEMFDCFLVKLILLQESILLEVILYSFFN